MDATIDKQNETVNIFIIEDDEGDVLELKRALKKGLSKLVEYTITTADSTDKALTIAENNNFDLIFLDLNLPDSNQLETLSKIYEIYPHVPIIILTGYEDGQMAKQAMELGAQDYLIKGELPPEFIARCITCSMIRKKSELKLLQISENKSNFLSNMSHEIRTPLNVISGITEIIKEKFTNPEVGRYITILNNSVESLFTLINNIIDLSKIEAGELEIHKSGCNPIEIVEKVSSIMSNYVAKKDIVFFYEVCNSIPKNVFLDQTRIEQILINLIGNAAKFTNEGQIKLSLDFDSAKQELCFSVSDTGIGIPKNKFKIIFEKFKQSDSSTTRKYGGSGLGLSIVKKMAILMNGSIDVDSEIGEGSTFSLKVPVDGSEHSDLVNYYDLGIDLSSKNILVICSNPGEQNILSNFLSFNKAQVTMSSSGVQAIQKYSNDLDKFDYIFIDVKMPVMGGFETFNELNKDSNIVSKTIFMFPPTKRNHDDSNLRKIKPKGHFHKPIDNACLFEVFSGKPKNTKGEDAEQYEISNESKNILLAEDFEENAIVVKEFLSSQNIKLTIVTNGEEAIEAVKENHYDLILMDMQMPKIDGLQATQSIREYETQNNLPKSKIVALTANVLNKDKVRCLKSGCDDFLSKPIKKKILLNTIKMHLETKGPSSQAVTHGPDLNQGHHHNNEVKMQDQRPKTESKEYLFKHEKIDEDFAEYIPNYMKNRWQDYDDLLKAQQDRDYKKISSICHRILGSAQTYGLYLLNEIVEELQINAKKDAHQAVQENLDCLGKYLHSSSQDTAAA